ncbi:AI-2E family transporter [Cardiobacteriales bacterium ML27]|uniref:AI-2E family transporter n=2 Tax=Ostreibacterium oceani TaxID=2654998 RepID=A0A6N7EWS3_9GAMM|nr:AI-2E family transporter [Ostreibacterium oceani]
MLIFIIAIALIVIYAGKILTPFLAALVIAYLLEGIISWFTKKRIPRIIVVNIVFLTFISFVIGIMLWAFPEIGRQAKQIGSNIPLYIEAGQDIILKLPERYPDLISTEQASTAVRHINREVTTFAQTALSGGVIKPLFWTVTVIIYLILVPVMVYFMLKDKRTIFSYCKRYLSVSNPLLKSVWHDVDKQIGNYIRGKFIEILIVWFVSFITFTLFELQYAMLLSFIVGISVLIPYIGATIVTLPIAIVAFVQWGIGSQFYLLMGVYLVIQILDGNVLAPLIFSEAVNIHPVAIIVAILVFGGIWGFWGIFFAIPLATVIKAVIDAWHSGLEELEITSTDT